MFKIYTRFQTTVWLKTIPVVAQNHAYLLGRTYLNCLYREYLPPSAPPRGEVWEVWVCGWVITETFGNIDVLRPFWVVLVHVDDRHKRIKEYTKPISVDRCNRYENTG